jgi:hypothetical protein
MTEGRSGRGPERRFQERNRVYSALLLKKAKQVPACSSNDNDSSFQVIAQSRENTSVISGFSSG